MSTEIVRQIQDAYVDVTGLLVNYPGQRGSHGYAATWWAVFVDANNKLIFPDPVMVDDRVNLKNWKHFIPQRKPLNRKKTESFNVKLHFGDIKVKWNTRRREWEIIDEPIVTPIDN